MRNIHLWITITVLSAAVICWGLWIMFKPHSAAHSDELLQNVLMEHIEYLPQVYRAHENYAEQLHNDTCAVLIYRYSSGMCTPCYRDDLMDLKEFVETIGRDRVLVLPAYPSNDRRSRMQVNSVTNGLRYKNIPADSLALPLHESEGEMRYFAVADAQGRVDMVFFPVKGHQNLTRRYLHEVAHFFSSHKDAKKESAGKQLIIF